MPRYTPAKLYSFSGDLTRSWYIYYSVENPATGKLVRYKLKGDLNKASGLRERRKVASEMIDEINELLRSGWNPYVSRELKHRTLEEVIADFLELKKASLRPRSWQSYKYCSSGFLKWIEKTHQPVIYPKDVTVSIARGWVDSMVKSGKAGKSVNISKEMVKTLFRMMVEREIIDKNPFDRIPPQPQDQGKNRAFTREEMELIWSHLNTPERYGQYMFTRLIYFCYIRPIEIIRLRRSNIDLHKNIITISGDQSKNRKTQSIVIPDAFTGELSLFLKGADPGDFIMGTKFRPGKRPMSRNIVSLRINQVLDELGFDSDYTLYSFKHSGVVAAYQAGIDLYSISRQLRHHSLVITQIYLKSLGLMPNTEFASKMV